MLLILLSLPLFAFAQETDSVKGYLLLQCNLPGVKYQINGREYIEVQYLPLTPGMYQVRAFGANPVTGPFAEERQMEIRQGETTVGKFDFPHGTLSLFSNETYARFTIDNAKLGKVENLPLPPEPTSDSHFAQGRHRVWGLPDHPSDNHPSRHASRPEYGF